MGGQIVNEEPKNDNYSIFYTFRSPKTGWALSNNFLHPGLCEKRPSSSVDFFGQVKYLYETHENLKIVTDFMF